MEKWQKLSVLIVGCGSIGKRHGQVLQALGVADIRACDPIVETRKVMAELTPGVKLYESFEAGLKDKPDTVLVCTEPKMHIPMITQAVEAGCHVLCEKPISDTPEGIDELIELVKKTGKKVMVALCFRYHEGIVKAYDYLQSGIVGRLVSIRALMGEHLPDVRPDYRGMFVSRYSGAFDLMHDIDLAVWVANLPVTKVHCIAGTYSDIGIEAPDVVELLIDFNGPCVATVHLDFFQTPRRRQFELICTEGVVIVEFARWDQCMVSLYETKTGEWQHEKMKTVRNDMFRDEDKEFLQAVAEDLPIKCTITQARKSLEVVTLAQKGGKE